MHSCDHHQPLCTRLRPAATCLRAGLGYNQQLAGIVVLSGWASLRDTYPGCINDANAKTPVLMCHGSADDKVASHYAHTRAVLLQCNRCTDALRAFAVVVDERALRWILSWHQSLPSCSPNMVSTWSSTSTSATFNVLFVQYFVLA